MEREGSGYVALCPEVDVASQGDSVAEARENLEEALALFFEVAPEEEIERRLRSEVYVTHVEVAVGNRAAALGIRVAGNRRCKGSRTQCRRATMSTKHDTLESVVDIGVLGVGPIADLTDCEHYASITRSSHSPVEGSPWET